MMPLVEASRISAQTYSLEYVEGGLSELRVLGVTQSAHQGDDVQAELALGKRECSFLFRSVRLVVKRAI